MGMPGGNRRENRNGAQGRRLRDTEALDGDHEFAGLAGTANIRAWGERNRTKTLAPYVGEGEQAASGVWLAADDGTKLFYPVPSATGEAQVPLPEPASEEDADQATLDAASWLMPQLPRELIAEVLQLGKYRADDGAP